MSNMTRAEEMERQTEVEEMWKSWCWVHWHCQNND